MYHITARFEHDCHSDGNVQADYGTGDHEMPEPLESWSLADFSDIVPGQLS
jgi:hypothetical protein